MSKLIIGRVLVAVSCLTLFHAAFSTYEHLSTLKALSRPETNLPVSIITEALVALAMFIPATALSYAPLQELTFRGEMAKRSIGDADARLGFMRLSERGRVLFGDPVRPDR